MSDRPFRDTLSGLRRPKPFEADPGEIPTDRSRVTPASLVPPDDAEETEPRGAVPSVSEYDHTTLTLLTGMSAGQVYAISRTETVVGRGPDCDIVIDDTAVSRRHARITRSPDGQCVIMDLGSKNGTFVSGREVTESELCPGDRVQLGPNIILRFAIIDETEETMQRRLYESSTYDSLTGVFNRKYFLERLPTEVAYARRHGTQIAVLMIDVDRFKEANDTHGHLAGDQLLRALTGILGHEIRREDVLARFGGEEFAVLARSGTKIEAERLAERLRAAVENRGIDLGEACVRVTVSIGVACLSECSSKAADVEIIALADARLYRAKGKGRNAVCAVD